MGLMALCLHDNKNNSGGLIYACTPAAARALDIGRAYHATAQGHSAVTGRPTIGCRQVALTNQRAVTGMRSSARGQTTQLSVSTRVDLTRKQGVFGHRG